MFSSASAQEAVGTVKLSKGFITTPDGELTITVEDRDLNTPVVQQQETQGRSPRGGSALVTYTIPAPCPGSTDAQVAASDCRGVDAQGNALGANTGANAGTGFAPDRVFRFRTQKSPIASGSPKQLLGGAFVVPGSSGNLANPDYFIEGLSDENPRPTSTSFEDVILTPAAWTWPPLSASSNAAWLTLTSPSSILEAAEQEYTDDNLDGTDPDAVHVDIYRHPYALENFAAGAFIIRNPEEAPSERLLFNQPIEFTVTYRAPDVQTAEVNLTSTTDNRGVRLLLRETQADTGKFTRTFKTQTAPQTTHIIDLRPGVIESEVNLNLDGLKASGAPSASTPTNAVVGDTSYRSASPTADITDREVDDDTLDGDWVTTEANIGIDLNGDGDYTATTTWIDLRQARQATIPPDARLGWRMNLPPTATGDDPPDDPQKDLCEDNDGTVEYDQFPEEGTADADLVADEYDITFDGEDVRICWVEMTAATDDPAHATMPAIAAAPGALITVTYDDAGERRVANATVEVTKPTIRVTSPLHNAATRVTSARLIAEITDSDSGVDLTKDGEDFEFIKFIVEAENLAGGSVSATGGFDVVNADRVTTVSIAGGVRAEATLQGVPSGETLITWRVEAWDVAGNKAVSDQNPADGPEATGEAAEEDGANLVEPDQYRLRIDTVAPTLGTISIDFDGGGDADMKTVDGAITGNYLDDDNNVVTDATKGRNTSVRMVFNENIKADTVQPDDFRVNGAAPAAAVTKDESVYLTVPAMASDARPDVRLSGPIDDLAGNTRQGGLRVEQAQDGISPTIEVTVNPDYHQSEVTIEVSSNEALLTAPTIRLSKDGQDDTNEAPGQGVSGLSAATLAGSDLYRATFKAPVQPFAYNVNVDVLDTSANPRSFGKAKADDDDATTIEIDKSLPAQTSVTLPGQAAITTIDSDKTYAVTTRNPFITIEWDSEGREYGRITDNKGTDVTTDDTAELTNDAGDIADVADDANLSFKSLDTHGTVDVTNLKIKVGDESYDVDTPTGDATNTRTSVAIDEDTSYTFNVTKPTKNRLLIAVRGLELGDYEMSFNGRDELGNTLKSDVKIKFEVKDPEPFEVKLTPGWNLVSLPASPQMTGINDVIPADHPASVVITYDPKVAGGWLSATRGEDGMFAGTLSEITGGVGYWIFTESFQSIKVPVVAVGGGGVVPLPTVNLVQGWNLLPVLDITGTKKSGDDLRSATSYVRGDILRAYEYDSSTDRYTVVGDNDNLMVGTGYWVYMSKAKVLVP